MNGLPSGTITFLFTDIEGSTRFWEQHREDMRRALTRHDELADQIISGCGGALFKSRGEGDSLFAVFARASDALQAACALQSAFITETWPRDTPLSVRMALHTGEAELRGGDYYGAAANRCARLRSAAHGGQVILSRTVYDLVRDHLPDGTGLRNLGKRRLRDLARPEQVYQLLYPGLPADFPPLRSLDSPEMPNNLPPQVTSFIGREKEMAEIKALVSEHRLVTLTGAGGSGKTRLCLQAAADLITGDGDGVWLVELAALSHSALVPQAIAEALGVREMAGMPLLQTLAEWLRAKRLLLVVDNCEHMIDACAALATTFLRNCPHVHLLLTSRQPLNVAGEQTYRVPPLSLPDPTKPQTVESFSQYEAVRLFIQRAHVVQPSFAVSNENAPAVAQICFRLDGIPLAIELAAARLRSLSLEEINTRLDNRFRLLTGGARNMLPRQQTLRATIDWSYDLLDTQEQTLFCALSVFVGGWTLPAAEAVCSVEGIEAWDVLDLLAGLVDKSLAVYEERAGRVPRYRLLETVRQYAWARLKERGITTVVQARHQEYFLWLAEEARKQWRGPEQEQWLEQLDHDHENVRAALDFCLDQAEGPQSGLRLGAAMGWFWVVQGYVSEGRSLLEKLLALPEAQKPTLVHAAILHGVGTLAWMQDDYAAAQNWLEESLALRQLLGDKRGMADTLNNLGGVALAQGNHSAARALHEKSLALERELGESWGIALSLDSLGGVAREQGDYSVARSLHEESLALQRETGDRRGIAHVLFSLGQLAYAEGDYRSARSLLKESLTLRQELGDKTGAARSLHSLGLLLVKDGDGTSAGACLRECLSLCADLGDQRLTASVLEAFAELAHRRQQPLRSVRLFGAAHALRQVIGSPVPPDEEAEQNSRREELTALLGKDAYTSAFREGQAMTLEQVIAYAVSDAGPLAHSMVQWERYL